jgi:hypothetical protein
MPSKSRPAPSDALATTMIPPDSAAPGPRSRLFQTPTRGEQDNRATGNICAGERSHYSLASPAMPVIRSLRYFRARPSRRDTCIWEMPSSCPICCWVIWRTQMGRRVGRCRDG